MISNSLFFRRLALAPRFATPRFSTLARLVAGFCLAGFLWLGATPARANDLEQAEQLLASLTARGFEVLPLSRGYGLRPVKDTDYRLIEAIDERVYLDGKQLEGAALVERVGPEIASYLEALAQIATEARALELEREIEAKQEQLEQLRDRPSYPEATDPDPPAPNSRPTATESPTKADPPDPLPRREDQDRPRRRSAGEDVLLGGVRTVGKGESSPGLVLLGGYLRVEEGGKLDGDATVVGGVVEIYGRIEGSLVVVGGSNTLGPAASISQDLVTIGARLDRDHRAEVGGETVQMATGDWRWLRDLWEPQRAWSSGTFDLFDGSPFSLFFGAMRTAILVFLIWVLLLLAPQRITAIAVRSRAEPWRSVLVGMLVQILLIPLLVVIAAILIITLIGIPFLLVIPPLIVLTFIFYNLIGFAGIATAAGRLFASRWQNRFVLATAGALLIQSCYLLGEAMDLFTGPLGLFAGFVLAIGLLVKYAAWTVGLGATVLERYSRPLEAPATGQNSENAALISSANPESP